jgi:hypothetical protein
MDFDQLMVRIKGVAINLVYLAAQPRRLADEKMKLSRQYFFVI